jgi:hypothetical protein
MKKILVLFLILSLALMGMGCSGWIRKNKRVATIVLLLTAMNSSKEHIEEVPEGYDEKNNEDVASDTSEE